jgi:predicted dehydrogenase
VFTRDLLTNPAIRGVTDLKHEVVAAASSTSAARAGEFLTKVKAPSTAKAHGSYTELVQDPNVNIVYVATPHSHHFQNAMLCLQAGKHVLCEKALTVNAAQAKKLCQVAKEKNLFFMEAVWTRFFPLSIAIRDMIRAGKIGPVHRVAADNTLNTTFDNTHRMVNMDLAGGALLDLGIYSLTWVFQILYHLQQTRPREAPQVLAAINKYGPTGCDEETSMILKFATQKTMGVALTGMRGGVAKVPTTAPQVVISGTKGAIQVEGPIFRPTVFRIQWQNGEVEEHSYPIPTDPERDNWGHGMFWEADEVARCIRDGKLESPRLGWEESIVIMETMDEVRRQGDLAYPELIETAEFDPESPLNTGAR